jgi:uncharacterized membrane protein
VLVRTVRAALALGIIAAAATHTIATELLPVHIGFFTENLLPPEQRHLVLVLMAAAFVVIAATVVVVVRREPDRSSAGAEWLARLLCPLLVLPVAMVLLRHAWAEDAVMALTLAMFGFALERLARESALAWAERPPEAGSLLFAAPRAFFARPRLVFGTLLVLTLGHAVFMSLWAVFAHQRFATYGYDLGQYDQVFQSVLGGRPLRLPSLGWDQNWGGLNGHADFASFYLAPIYALYPHAQTLLVMQATLLASATLPVYWFARNRLPQPHAFALGLAWLIYAPLHGAQLYDVHMQPFGCVWVMWAIAAVDAKRFKLYWLFFVFAILCREDVSIGLATLGAFMFLSGYRVRTGVASAIAATGYFLVLRFALMGNQYFAETFKLLYPPGESGFIPVIKTIVSNPGYTLRTLVTWEKIRYVAQVFAPLVFLPLRRPLHWLLMVPGFLLTLIATAYLPPIQISFQYVCNWAAYSFAAAALVLAAFDDNTLGRARRAGATWALIAASVLACVQWGAYSTYPMVRGGFSEVPFLPPNAADRQREVDLQQVMKKVPKTAVLCAADRIQAHVTYHLSTWSLRDGTYDCEYLLFSDLPGDLGNDRGRQAVAAGQYEAIERKGEITLAKRKR